MAWNLPSEGERQVLRRQYEDLSDYGTTALIAQFSFLDPNWVHKAKMDYLGDCYTNIDKPLLPIFLRPFSEDQIKDIKKGWHDQRYMRIDFWQQLEASARKAGGGSEQPTPVPMHRDYLLTKQSLSMLQGLIWSVVAPPPEYLQNAMANAANVQIQRFRAKSDARGREMRLSTAEVQTECLGFLLAALLETATSAQLSDTKE
jgi:hypothetical protein